MYSDEGIEVQVFAQALSSHEETEKEVVAALVAAWPEQLWPESNKTANFSFIVQSKQHQEKSRHNTEHRRISALH